MATTTVYLVRHGQADGYDDADPALTDVERIQAADVAAALSGCGVDEVLHGSRRRAAQTASVLASALDVPARASTACEDRTPIPEDWSLVPERFHAHLRSVPVDEADVGGRLLDEAVETLSVVGSVDRTLVAVTHNFRDRVVRANRARRAVAALDRHRQRPLRCHGDPMGARHRAATPVLQRPASGSVKAGRTSRNQGATTSSRMRRRVW